MFFDCDNVLVKFGHLLFPIFDSTNISIIIVMSREKMKKKRNFEKKFAAQLDAEKIQYVQEVMFDSEFGGRKWRVDFMLPEHNIAIEIEGVQYTGKNRHQTKKGYEGDLRKYNVLTLSGITLYRFSGDMVESGEAILFLVWGIR